MGSDYQLTLPHLFDFSDLYDLSLSYEFGSYFDLDLSALLDDHGKHQAPNTNPEDGFAMYLNGANALDGTAPFGPQHVSMASFVNPNALHSASAAPGPMQPMHMATHGAAITVLVPPGLFASNGQHQLHSLGIQPMLAGLPFLQNIQNLHGQVQPAQFQHVQPFQVGPALQPAQQTATYPPSPVHDDELYERYLDFNADTAARDPFYAPALKQHKRKREEEVNTRRQRVGVCVPPTPLPSSPSAFAGGAHSTQSHSNPAAVSEPLAADHAEHPRKVALGIIDVVSEILSYITSRADLALIARVSRTFNAAAVPKLYRRMPVVYGSSLDPEVKRRCVRTIELGEHAHGYLPGVAREAPVRTVIFNIKTDTFAFALNCQGCDNIGAGTRVVFPPKLCPKLENGHTYRFFAPYVPAAQVVAYVQRAQPQYGAALSCLPHPKVLPTLPWSQAYTFVVLPIAWDGIGTVQRAHFCARKDKQSRFESTLFDSIARFFISNAGRGPEGSLTLVGIEDENPYAPLAAHWAERAERAKTNQAAVLERIAKHCRAIAALEAPFPPWLAEDTERLFASIRFVSFKDYLLAGEWRDELDYRLVARWLRALDERSAHPGALPDYQREAFLHDWKKKVLQG